MLNAVNPLDPLDHPISLYEVPVAPASPNGSLLAEPPTLVLALICVGTLAAFGLVKRVRGTSKRSTGASGTKIPVPQFETPAQAPGEAAKRAA